jgi:hypothetical protein
MRRRTVGSLVLIVPLAACGPRPTPEERAQAVAAFATVQEVFQHPRTGGSERRAGGSSRVVASALAAHCSTAYLSIQE